MSVRDLLLQEVSNHDELMSNFFAQPDALANGKTLEEVLAEVVPLQSRCLCLLTLHTVSLTCRYVPPGT